MKNFILNYINSLSVQNIIDIAKSKNINLSLNEAEYIYNFLKRNKEDLINNPLSYNIENYKNNFQPDNFIKIKQLIDEYKKLIK